MTFGLRGRWMLATISLIAGVSILAGSIFARKMDAMLESQFEERIATAARNLSYVAVYGVFTENEEILDDLLRRVLADEEILGVRIVNEEGRVIAERHRAGGEGWTERRVPIVLDLSRESSLGDEFDIFTEPSAEDLALPQRRYRALGFAVLRFSRRRITETLHLFYTFAVITTLLMIGAGALVTFLLSRKVLAPLHEIVDATREISQGNLDREVPVRTHDEIGTLAEAFNEMTRSLAQSRRELEASLKALAQREKLASLGELTAGIAHELRNPLSTIISSAQIVADPRRSEEQRRRFSGYILDEAKRLSTTLTKFLAFARPNEPHIVAVATAEVLTKAVDLFRQELDAVGIRLETDLPEELPETLRCDPNQLHQVLLNLLINARDAIASQGEGEEGQITLRARAGKDHLQIEISDTGCGIPPENLKRIFDPFFSTKSDGTGLGLPTVFQIVKSHGGDLSVESRVGEGTTFTLTLPLHPSLDSGARTPH